MRRPDFARLNPWARKRERRLEQFLETESHEYRDAIERHRKDRDERERQIDLDLFQERREGSNWLENREMRMSAMVLDYQRTLIAARIEIRKRLGLECPALLSDDQLSKLEETMLQSVHVGRQRPGVMITSAGCAPQAYRPTVQSMKTPPSMAIWKHWYGAKSGNWRLPAPLAAPATSPRAASYPFSRPVRNDGSR